MIKRIIKFIPKSEYNKIYDALFKSHLTYCISSWGGVSSTKLQGVFAIQKRCIRLLFGNEYSFDHAGFYETCARTRSYIEHKSDKNYCLEHTKPIFNKHKLMALPNLYVYHTFLELFKILKTHIPVSLFCLFTHSQRDTSMMVHLPKFDLEISRHNFVFKSTTLWNSLIDKILEKSATNKDGLVIRGSVINSDFCATIPFIKSRLRMIILQQQALGDETNWTKENSLAI